MKYKILPIIEEFDLRSALFLQYDYEFDLIYLLDLGDEVVEVSLERSSYDIEDETEAMQMDLVIGYLNDCFPAFGSVMIMNR